MSSSISQLLQSGMDNHRAGRLQEAEACYRSVREQKPEHPDAWHLLGVIAQQVGKNDQAVKLVEQAIKLNPGTADFYITCAEAYRAQGQHGLAIERLQQALALRPDFAGAHLNLGNVYQDMGDLAAAAEHFQQAIRLEPAFPIAHNNLGTVLKDTGRGQESLDCFSKAVELMPGYFEAHNNRGNALFNLGRLDEAIASYQQALQLNPGYAEAHSNLGNALKQLGRAGEALIHYERAISIKPDFAMAYCNLGTALDDLGRPEEAITRYEQALAHQPDYAEAHNNLGNALDETGRQADAIAHYERAIAIRPDYAEAHRNLARLDPGAERVTALQQLLEMPGLSELDTIHCHFALGSILHEGEQFERAFEHYLKGNALKRGSIEFDARAVSDYVDELVAAYSATRLQEAAPLGSDSELPVFIVGMPRSGTSLVEQIVASHPQVYGAGELHYLVQVEEDIRARFAGSDPYPRCMAGFDQALAQEFANQYLQRLERFASDALRITDKLPGNFFRVGLIKTLFPGARIIHCQRNAMDTCISNFLNYFSFGNEYAFDLEELGRYYLEYERLMAHWQQVVPTGMLTVRYEELVMGQEEVSRQIIDFLGLEWDERCLDFHKNTRAVNSFSSRQVRRPVYREAMDRWKQYETQLAPLSAIIQTSNTAGQAGGAGRP